MPIDIISSLQPLFNSGTGVAAIFAGLFIWIIVDTRKEGAKREEIARADSAAREALIREDRDKEQVKADAREAWFRITIEKSQTTESRILEKLETMDKRLERIETRETARKGA